MTTVDMTTVELLPRLRALPGWQAATDRLRGHAVLLVAKGAAAELGVDLLVLDQLLGRAA